MTEARRTVSLVRSEYQPGKAKLEKPIDIRREDGAQFDTGGTASRGALARVGQLEGST